MIWDGEIHLEDEEGGIKNNSKEEHRIYQRMNPGTKPTGY